MFLTQVLNPAYNMKRSDIKALHTFLILKNASQLKMMTVKKWFSHAEARHQMKK
jgi:hypothetical protein